MSEGTKYYIVSNLMENVTFGQVYKQKVFNSCLFPD